MGFAEFFEPANAAGRGEKGKGSVKGKTAEELMMNVEF